MKTATELAQKIADQELEACCEWLCTLESKWQLIRIADLRAARRPKPPSLKEQALGRFRSLITDLTCELA